VGKTRAVRLSDEESRRVDQFIKLNPFFDFSSLVRTALMEFIAAPRLQIRPLAPNNESKSKPKTRTTHD
jgi:hypothetical protein